MESFDGTRRNVMMAKVDAYRWGHWSRPIYDGLLEPCSFKHNIYPGLSGHPVYILQHDKSAVSDGILVSTRVGRSGNVVQRHFVNGVIFSKLCDNVWHRCLLIVQSRASLNYSLLSVLVLLQLLPAEGDGITIYIGQDFKGAFQK
jgi:hypothetical protein